GRVVYGAYDPKAGACGSLFNLASDPRLNHEFEVIGGVRAEDSAALLEAFFKRLRSQDKEKTAAAPGAGT
ncbi:MAG TPA: tRNA-specific adenosine deaminase, partial [Acidimicrobiales bacterium]|nr:tRNA-specific adenosine deaminase [Acidimicrobiales bacterium]